VSVIDVVLQIALSVTLTAWVVRRDMRRAPPERLLRAWNEASFWSAVVAFGPLCIPVHFVRTRRSFAGLAIGVAWMTAVMVTLSLIGEGVTRLSTLGAR
jgi:hypothetical protein